MPLDIVSRSGVAQWLDDAERAESDSVGAELDAQRIARETGQRCLKTAALNWDLLIVSGSPQGALTPTNAQSLTRASLRHRHARRAALRGSGLDAFLRAIRAA